MAGVLNPLGAGSLALGGARAPGMGANLGMEGWRGYRQPTNCFGDHRSVEEVFIAAKGEAGLGKYEVRSWEGRHHPMTLLFLALWFLILERIRVGGKNPGRDSVAGAGNLHPSVAVPGPEP